MKNTPVQTRQEISPAIKPTSTHAESDPLLLAWNQAELEPFAEISASPQQAERQAEFSDLLLTGSENQPDHLQGKVEKMRHLLSNAWQAMEHAVDDAISSLSNGRDL